MSKEQLINKRQEIFNEDWSLRIFDLNKILDFCNFLTNYTGIQCCTSKGYIFDHMPAVYDSVIARLS